MTAPTRDPARARRCPSTACLAVALIAAAVSLGQTAARAADALPELAAAGFIEKLRRDSLALLPSEGRDAVEPTAVLGDLIRESVDLGFLGQIALGRFRRAASPAQIREFHGLYSAYLVHMLARHLSQARDRRFQVTGSKSLSPSQVVVRTEVGREREHALTVDWQVRAANGEHRIVDITIEGVSLALTLRGEFASAIRRQGAEGLLVALRNRTLSDEPASNKTQQASAGVGRYLLLLDPLLAGSARISGQ